MATDEIKEMLVEYHSGTTEKDWKRLSKKKMGPDKVEVRTFENTQNGYQVWVFGDADDEAWHPAGDHLYYLGHYEGDLIAMFNPVSYWNSDKCLWDQHTADYICTMFNLPDWMEMDEVMENQTIITFPENKTEADVKAAFEAAGLLFDQAFHDYMAKWN